MEAPVTNKYIADKLKEVAKQRANKGEKFPAAAFNKAANIVLKHFNFIFALLPTIEKV